MEINQQAIPASHQNRGKTHPLIKTLFYFYWFIYDIVGNAF